MPKSTFYADGYRDGDRGDDASPPDVKVYADEYWTGYVTAIERNFDQRTFYEGANDTNADYPN